MLRPYPRTCPRLANRLSGEAPPGDADHFLDELVVAEPCGARRLGEAGVHGRIGDDARQGVELEDVRHAEPVHAEVHPRSEEHTSELQSLAYLVCRLLLEKKKNTTRYRSPA